MAQLTIGQVYGLARDAGLDQQHAAVAAAIAMAESGGRTDAVGDVALEDDTWGPSVGLWQIRSLKAQEGTGQPRDASRLTDPAFNARSMVSISQNGNQFNPWTTFKTGAYLKYLDGSVSKAAGTVGGPIGAAAGGVIDTVGGAVAGLTTSWGKDAMTIALKVVGGIAVAGMFVAGAIYTVNGQKIIEQAAPAAAMAA